MRTIFLQKFTEKRIQGLVRRPAINLVRISPLVKNILASVEKQGDKAVKEYTKAFDKVEVGVLEVTAAEIARAIREIQPATQKAFKRAAANIEKFHNAQLIKEKPVQTMPGVLCWREWKAIEKVGLYVPKGLPSTVLMLGIPARIAGCKSIIMCTPPDKDGTIQKEILLAAKIAGVSKIFKVGGAQAIGALAYGTQTIPKVDKIFGPGNQFVTAAKMLVSIDPLGAAIDFPAGPSEVLVIADKKANPVFVAADLLSQAEHGPDSPFILVTNSKKLAGNVKMELDVQIKKLPLLRKKALSASLKPSLIIVTKSLAQGLMFSNLYAPEHLILNVKNPQIYILKIRNAGSVFIGEWSPESVGDYASGTNHSLPTSGYAKSHSGVSVDSFVKKITFQKLSKVGLQNIASIVETIAEVEQLAAHKNAVTVRIERQNKQVYT